MEQKRFIQAFDDRLRYMGRIGEEKKECKIFYYAGSSVTVCFIGTGIELEIENIALWNDSYLGYVLDGREDVIKLERNNEKIIIRIDADSCDMHELVVFKRQDGCHYFKLYGFYADRDTEVISYEGVNRLKIECYGDSVCCGELCELAGLEGNGDPLDRGQGSYDNAWYAFPMIVSRMLNADINNVSQGGMALLDNTGWYYIPDCIGLESVYDKLCYIPEADVTEWDFSKYTPDIVIIEIGQNDRHKDGQEDNDIDEMLFRKRWKRAYHRIISHLMEEYAEVQIILLTTIMNHDIKWDKAIDEIWKEVGDERVHRFYFKRNGQATEGHPRIKEQNEMAEELLEFIKGLDLA